MTCVICGEQLTGLKTMYCSPQCKGRAPTAKEKTAVAMRVRRKERMEMFINEAGGKCQFCGYKKNTAALAFHHTRKKLFPINVGHCSSKNLKTLRNELKKCILLCHNCHMELHHPEFNIEG